MKNYIQYLKGKYKYVLALSDAMPNVIFRAGGLWLKHELRFDPKVRLVASAFLAVVHEDEKSFLLIRNGYAWDGASGPTIDTRNSQRGSLIHDALWQLLEEGSLPEVLRDATNEELRRVLVEDKMTRARAASWKFVLSKVGTRWVKTFGRKRKVFKAPKI